MRTAISIFGKDRPGIIASLTKKLADVGANIEDASMTLLQGHFAMILVVEIDSTTTHDIEQALQGVDELGGFSLAFSHELDDIDPLIQDHKVAKYVFHLSVSDTPGIVARVTEVLGRHDANVVDCATRKNNATGVFTMVLDVDVPLADENAIVDELSSAAAQFSGDVVFQRVDDIDL